MNDGVCELSQTNSKTLTPQRIVSGFGRRSAGRKWRGCPGSCRRVGTEIDQLKDWVARRVAWIDSQFILPPELSHPGEPVSTGLEVTVSSPHGELYYTLNGPDPMSADRQAVPEALSSMDPVVITMTENTRIRARGRISENVWTEMTEAIYVTDPIPLVVTEIMYNPLSESDSSFSRSNFEFIELKNIGSEPLNLDGV